jgi:monolysocardiolipin acyltransferase
MSESAREAAAVARWKPGKRWYHPFVAFLTIRLSRFIMRTMNSLEIEGAERFQALKQRQGRGLLTFSNHVAMFDDPILPSNFDLPPFDGLRWCAADALNFFGTAPKAWLFTVGKGVPIVRGSGLGQTGFGFLRDRLNEGDWVHIFPEGGRTRDPEGLMRLPFKAGVGRLMAEAHPIALPYYHHGMREVLPLGALRPRRGKVVRLAFGEPIDCDEAYVEAAAREAGLAEASGPQLWQALTDRAYEALRRMELEMHPAARDRAAVAATEPGA